MEKALHSILANDPTVKGLVGSNIFPMRRSDDTNSVVYEKIGRSQTKFINGDNSGIVTSEFTITCRGETFSKAKEISTAVAAALESAKGVYLSVKILLCTLNNEQHSQVFDEKISEITLDFSIIHNP